MALPLTSRDKDLLLSAFGLPETRDRVVALLDLAGTGNMTGPVSSTDNALARFNGATGALVQNSGIIVDDSNNISGIASFSSSGPFLAGNGTAGAPSYSFTVDPDSGVFRRGNNEVGISVGGFDGVSISTPGGMTLYVGQMQVQNGTAAAPGYVFSGDPDTGWYHRAGNQLGCSTNTTDCLVLDTDVRAEKGDLKANLLGKGLAIAEGVNARMGRSVLVAGSVTVATTAVAANSEVFITSQIDGGTPGWLRVSARNAGVDFTITSSDAGDTSTVAWMIVNPA